MIETVQFIDEMDDVGYRWWREGGVIGHGVLLFK